MSRKGFTLAETLVTIGITAVVLAVYASMLYGTFFLRRVQYNVQATNFIQEELDTLRSLPYYELLNRTDGNFLGIPLQRGSWMVRTDSTAPEGIKLLRLESSASALIEETGLAILPGNWRKNFTARAKIRVQPASPPGWGAGIAFRYRDAENHYRFRISSGGFALDKVRKGVKTTVWSQGISMQTDVWYTLEVVTNGTSLTLKRNGAILATVTDSAFSAGEIAVFAANGAKIDADDAAVIAVTTEQWGFESAADGKFPADWQRLSFADLPSGSGKLTIENYLGQSNIKKITAKISWNDAGFTRSMSGSTVISK